MSTYDYEPVRGLPGRLPEGETILWQGSPQWRILAVHLCHVRFVTAYFLLLMGWAIASTASDGRPFTDAVGGIAALAVFLGVVVGLLCLFSWGVSRTTIYTITNKRLVLRYGIALTKAVNVPFSSVAGANLRLYSNGSGDISLPLLAGNKLAYLLLWPHTRPWCFKNPEPMMRGIANASAVAETLRLVAAPDKNKAQTVTSPRAGTEVNTEASGRKFAAKAA